ncbi:DMT family transporter [Pseudomonas wadenswilerensis]|jgi:transporter family-2 protein|uniref:Membrane protein n=1 Tax=Pseudomonas wadenswilerensis TaxID=1785161 RepID=A0A380T4L3_9PSED|nr:MULTISPECIES: DMT family transporter [Pseudomonas]MCE5984070.1 DMT family transporter [Pseudomonas sp. LF19]SUQ65197.1 Membrane protein [Pseudomonas wadenswilerensis]
MNLPAITATLLPLAIALLAGAAVPFQAGSNAALGRLLGHPLWASLVSLAVSVLMVIPALLVLRAPLPQLNALVQAPWWAWLGGVAGVAYITAALVLTPRLGAAGFIVCVIAGQVLSSLIIDQWGLMGLPERPVNGLRLAGVGLIVVGMLVVQWGTSTSAR